MTVREETERIEKAVLSPYAALSAQTRGRERPMEKCDLRTEFQRDRDRIIHCKSFRRLKHKTQVFLSPEGDHYRTRLTHTLEVAQVARTIARALRLNEDLTEAIALGHDLGHTPFGHAGERVLDNIMREQDPPMSFLHNVQSLRVVEVLENGTGLNLTYEVRDGILNHSGEATAETLEGKVVHFADRIAYINHDIDDAIRAGIIDQSMIDPECLRVLGETHGQRINTMIKDIVATSAGKPYIMMSEEVWEQTNNLRQFLFDNVYTNPEAKSEEKKAEVFLRQLFSYYMDNPGEMPPQHRQNAERFGLGQAVCDYIAGMTDRYAINEFENIFIPRVWKI